MSKMSLNQALGIAALVLDFEVENAVPTARAWAYECRQAAGVIRAAIDNPPPEWMTRADGAHRTNFNLAGSFSRQDNSYTTQDRRRRR